MEYYDSRSLEAVVTVLSQRLRVAVDEIRYGIGFCAGIDPKTGKGFVQLSKDWPMSTSEWFQATAGSILHELSHWSYNTVPEFKAFAVIHKDDPLLVDCYNAVVDVADETRTERFSPYHSAVAFFQQSTGACLKRAMQQDLWSRRSKAPKHSEILIGALFLTRGFQSSFSGYSHRMLGNMLRRTLLQSGEGQWGALCQCVKVLRRCRTPKSLKKQWPRNRRSWLALCRRADELRKILDPWAPPPGASPTGLLNPFILEVGKGHDAGPPKTGPDDTLVTPDVMEKRLRESAPACPPTESPVKVETSKSDKIGSDAPPTRDNPPPVGEYFDWSLYMTMRKVFQHYASKITKARSSLAPEPGHRRGSVLDDVTRVYTDQCAFSQPLDPGANAAVAFCLDASGSMRSPSHYPTYKWAASVCKAFLESLRNLADTRLYRFTNTVSRINPDKLLSDYPHGGTRTDRALEAARKWLVSYPSTTRRILVILTDGMPSSTTFTQQQSLLCKRKGIFLLGMGIAVDLPRLQNTLPGALVINASNLLSTKMGLLQTLKVIDHRSI